MAPSKSKASSTPAAAANDSRKAIDALWLFEQFMHCDPPVILNVAGIAEATGAKANTIMKRLNTLQHRYPGFGISPRSTGPKQSSNLVAGSPRTVADIPAKRSIAKNSKNQEKPDQSENGGDEAGDREEDSKRKTRGQSRVERLRRDNEADDTPSQKKTRGSTTNKATDQEKTTKTSEKPRTKTSGKPKTAPKFSKAIEGDTNDAETDDTEDEMPAKKAATPKTRGGRKSAGLGDLATPRKDPEKVVPRGRHASSNKDNISEQVGESTDEVAGTNNVEVAMVHGLERIPAALDLSTKRKRSASPETPSSPLTPLPDIGKRLDDLESTEADEMEVDGTDHANSPDGRPPTKRVKPNTPVTLDSASSTDALPTTDGSSDDAEDFDIISKVAKVLELANAKDKALQFAKARNLDISLDPTNHSKLTTENSVLTTPGRSINDMSTEDSAGSSEEDMGGADNQEFRQSVSPSPKQKTPRKRIALLREPDSEVGRGKAAQQGTEADAEEEVEVEVQRTLQSETVDPAARSEDAILGDKRAGNDTSSASDTPALPAVEARVDGMVEVGIERPKSPEKKSIFSRPLEWMVWKPAGKPAKVTNTP